MHTPPPAWFTLLLATFACIGAVFTLKYAIMFAIDLYDALQIYLRNNRKKP